MQCAEDGVEGVGEEPRAVGVTLPDTLSGADIALPDGGRVTGVGTRRGRAADRESTSPDEEGGAGDVLALDGGEHMLERARVGDGAHSGIAACLVKAVPEVV